MAEALRKGLEAGQFSVSIAQTAEEGFFLASAEPYRLDASSARRCRSARGFATKSVSVPVLILTSKDRVKDRVRGPDLGVDDYLVKPFAFPELAARIRALLRRGKPEPDHTLRLADIEMDVAGRTVLRKGGELTAREFDLLHYLLRNQGRARRSRPSPAS